MTSEGGIGCEGRRARVVDGEQLELEEDEERTNLRICLGRALLQREGKVSGEEMRDVFNLGVGMIAVLPAAAVEAVRQSATAAAIGSWVLGEVRSGVTGVRFA